MSIQERDATSASTVFEPSIDVEDGDGFVLIRLFGEHDAGNCWKIQQAVSRAAIEGRGAAVSLADVTFMDSSVIRALIIADRTLMSHGRRLSVYVEPGSVADRALELGQLNDLLLFGDTVDEAVMFAQQSGPSVS